MKAFKKVLTLLLVSGLMVVSIGANDVVGVGNSSSDADLMRRGGLCVECGSTRIVRNEMCSTYSEFPAVSTSCGEHTSCEKIYVYAFRFYEDKCTQCGYVQGSGRISNDAHTEFCYHTSNGEVEVICTLDGHMT